MSIFRHMILCAVVMPLTMGIFASTIEVFLFYTGTEWVYSLDRKDHLWKIRRYIYCAHPVIKSLDNYYALNDKYPASIDEIEDVLAEPLQYAPGRHFKIDYNATSTGYSVSIKVGRHDLLFSNKDEIWRLWCFYDSPVYEDLYE